MIGEISALGSAMAVSAAAVINKSLTSKFSSLPLQTLRAIFGGLSLVFLALALGSVARLSTVTLSLLGLMTASAFAATILGDTLYVKAVSLTEVSRVFPTVRSAQILFSMFISGLFLGETIGWELAVGAALIVVGVYLAASARSTEKPKVAVKPVSRKTWLILSIAVGLCWAISFSVMKIVMESVEPVLANTIRFVIAVPILAVMVIGSGQGESLKIAKHGAFTIFLIIASGILAYGVGAMLSMYAVHISGVSRVAVLTSTSPFWVLAFSMLFLKEKLTLKLGLGTALCVTGILLLVLL